jgi:hypothetical protein
MYVSVCEVIPTKQLTPFHFPLASHKHKQQTQQTKRRLKLLLLLFSFCNRFHSIIASCY